MGRQESWIIFASKTLKTIRSNSDKVYREMYAFLFDKKSLALVVLGFCLGALLFFGAGLAVGTHLDRPKDEVKWTL